MWWRRTTQILQDVIEILTGGNGEETHLELIVGAALAANFPDHSYFQKPQEAQKAQKVL